ncbi:cupredoxin domain-containing protein [Candidatus Woesearchaeota archaeon]|nr:cupredoxin domain-containing protein [Candidatus Woesearchaeota archaeon]
MRKLFLALLFVVIACSQVPLESPMPAPPVSPAPEPEAEVKASSVGEAIIAGLPVSRTKEGVRVRMTIDDVALVRPSGKSLLAGKAEIPQGTGQEMRELVSRTAAIGRYEQVEFSASVRVDVSGVVKDAVMPSKRFVAEVPVFVNEVGSTVVVLRLDPEVSLFKTVKGEFVFLPVFDVRSTDSVSLRREGDVLTVLSDRVVAERRFGMDLSGRIQSGAVVSKHTLLDIVEGVVVKAVEARQENHTLSRITKNVQISGRHFDPADLTVPAGSTVNWYNQGPADHTVLFEGDKESPKIKAGSLYSKTFNTPGTYKYKCGIHTEMKGKIVVV